VSYGSSSSNDINQGRSLATEQVDSEDAHVVSEVKKLNTIFTLLDTFIEGFQLNNEGKRGTNALIY